MVRLRMGLPAVMLVVALGILALSTAGTHAQGSPSVVLQEGSPSQFATFTFLGTGWEPGELVNDTFIGPDGTVYEYQVNGVPHDLVVGADGRFTLSIVPASDLVGGVFGVWTARFCSTTFQDICIVIEFNIAE